MPAGAATQSGLEAAIPVLITALSRNAQSEKGAAGLHDAITSDHDGSVMDGAEGVVGRLFNPKRD